MMLHLMKRSVRFTPVAVLVLAALLGTAAPAVAEVPSPESFLGYPVGARFTPHHRILDYFEALAAASPRIKVERFGETWEHRPLFYGVITSEENQSRLDAIRSGIGSIQDPRSLAPAAAESVATTTPAVVWLAFGVHGNESSSSEAAMLTAWWLLSSPDSEDLLKNLVVIIEPTENPDGRERYVEWYRQREGTRPDPSRDAMEHYEPWPGGRYNHYLVDLNRDWAWETQPETRARVRAYQRWNPQVFVDFHEMGYNDTYFFPPSASPVNANVDPEIMHWLETFGKGNAAAFSAEGWPFFVAEDFDLFYPGYGDSWPSLHGAVGMTYEMAGGGRAGLAVERQDETVLTLGDRARHHFTAAVATLKTAAANRHDLILHSYRALRSQVSQASPTTFFMLAGSPEFDDAIRILERQQIEVKALSQPLRVKATRIGDGATQVRDLPAGTAVIRTDQPLGALARTLLEQNPILPEEFVRAERAKVQADEPADFYDLTGWSLPVSHNVETWQSSQPVNAPVEPLVLPVPTPVSVGRFGYLIRADDPHLYPAVGRMLARHLRFSVAREGIDLGSTKLPRGSLVILRNNNGKDLHQTLQSVQKETSVAILPVDEGWSGGTALGSTTFNFVVDPRIGILGGEPTDSTSFGELWYTFDVETSVPYTVLPTERFNSIDLGHYRVLIFPDGGSYADALGKRGIERLQEWTRGGGTIIAVGAGAEFLRQKDIEISGIKTRPQNETEEKADSGEKRYNDYDIPGAAFRTRMNDRSYLTFGLPGSPYVLLVGSTALLPVSHSVDNIVTIDPDAPLVSGFVWPESLERVRGSAFMVSERYGRGKVITFAQEPFFRLFWRGTMPLLMNAALYSPSF